jgi:hypothetical protein
MSYPLIVKEEKYDLKTLNLGLDGRGNDIQVSVVMIRMLTCVSVSCHLLLKRTQEQKNMEFPVN